MAKGESRFTGRFDRKKQAKDWAKAAMPDEEDMVDVPPVEQIKSDDKPPGRNDPCPCGSGKKYKKCCAGK